MALAVLCLWLKLHTEENNLLKTRTNQNLNDKQWARENRTRENRRNKETNLQQIKINKKKALKEPGKCTENKIEERKAKNHF